MSRNTVMLIWGLGALLALVLIFAGPNPVEQALQDTMDRLEIAVERLSGPGMAAVRGVAIALFCVFLALCIVALRQGQAAVGLAVVVSVLFLLLTGHVFAYVIYLHRPHWVLALLLVLLSSLMMTRRVTAPFPVRRRG